MARRYILFGWLLLVVGLLVLYLVGQWMNDKSLLDGATLLLLRLALPIGAVLTVAYALHLLKAHLERSRAATDSEDHAVPKAGGVRPATGFAFVGIIALWLFKLILAGTASLLLFFAYAFWHNDAEPPAVVVVMGLVAALYLSVKAHPGWLLLILAASSVLFVHGCVSNFRWAGG